MENGHNQPQPLLTTEDAARILACSVFTIRRWVKEGKLKGTRLPGGQLRFRRADLEGVMT